MRDRSKRVANKGLELACFVAERLGGFPDGTGAFAFDWEPGDEDIDGAGDGDGGGEDGAWNSGGREEARFVFGCFSVHVRVREKLSFFV